MPDLLRTTQFIATSLNFLTKFLKAYLLTETIDHLSTSLRKGNVADLKLFFPPSRQSLAELQSYFRAEGLGPVLDFYTKQKSGQAKEETLFRLKELVAEESDNDEVYFSTTARRKRIDD